MNTVTTKDGVEIFYKDWGKGQPIVFSHGWPLSADDWDAQMLFFLDHGYRVIAHDRRGHGRSTQVGRRSRHGSLCRRPRHADRASRSEERDSRRPFDRRRRGRALPRTARREPRGEGRHHQRGAAVDGEDSGQSGGLPKEVFDGFQAQLAANRSQFYRDVAAGPFYNYNRPGAKASEATIQNWWRQGMMGGAKAHYDGIVAFSQTDFTADLKKINVPVLVMHSEDDQIVPYADAGPLSAKLLKNGDAENLQGLPARHADHAGRADQRRFAGIYQRLNALSANGTIIQHALKELVIMGTHTLIATGASAQSARDIRGPSPLVALENEPPPKLIVDPPLPEQLAQGLVFIQYRTENLRVVPVFGEGALDVSPRVGHVHITVDDGPWHFVDASGETVILVGLPSGSHKVLFELADPTHRVITSETVRFVVPDPNTAGWPTKMSDCAHPAD